MPIIPTIWEEDSRSRPAQAKSVTSYQKNKKPKRAGSMAQVVESLPSRCKPQYHHHKKRS
jgi:hypothetical protein